jgi:Rha family phage regulatory protein
VEVQDGENLVNSRQVAYRFEKEHKNVLQNISEILAAEISATRFFHESTFKNRGKQYPIYNMNRDGFSLLAMGFTGKKALDWKLKFIKAFNEMEAKLKEQARPYADNTPKTYLESLKQLVAAVERVGSTVYRLYDKYDYLYR